MSGFAQRRSSHHGDCFAMHIIERFASEHTNVAARMEEKSDATPMTTSQSISQEELVPPEHRCSRPLNPRIYKSTFHTSTLIGLQQNALECPNLTDISSPHGTKGGHTHCIIANTRTLADFFGGKARRSKAFGANLVYLVNTSGINSSSSLENRESEKLFTRNGPPWINSSLIDLVRR